MDVRALALMGAALVILILSTRQIPLLVRSLIWLIGAGLLAASAFLELDSPSHYGLLQIARGAASGDPILRNALVSDLYTVADALTPLFDIFFVLSAAMAFLALIAFTPGETIERLTRPAITALIGGMCGAVLALGMVAAGFAGYVKHRTYTALIEAKDVYDGDTIRVDDYSLRVADIDAPELDQVCRDGARVVECGRDARDALIKLVDKKVIVCSRPKLDERKLSLALKETFGRPIVSCDILGRAEPKDLGKTMVATGFADIFRDRDSASKSYAQELAAATVQETGLWRFCSLKPRIWRNNREMKMNFERGNVAAIDKEMLLGRCPA